jgi:hypothetical protein
MSIVDVFAGLDVKSGRKCIRPLFQAVMSDMAEMCDRLSREGHYVYSSMKEHTPCIAE